MMQSDGQRRTAIMDDASLKVRKRAAQKIADRYIPEPRGRDEKPPTIEMFPEPAPGGVTPVKSQEREAVTLTEYGGLQIAYQHFNNTLFSGELPDVLLTYQRRAHSLGHFGGDRYSGRSGSDRVSEVSLNPDGFIDRTDEQIASTLVHEQVHVWQEQKGSAPKRKYHNKEWAAKMKSLGLQPSNTGMVGGKETGVQMNHFIIDGGPFDEAYRQLRATGWRLNWESTPTQGRPAAPKSKLKFTCPQCDQNVWGKPGANTLCGDCYDRDGGIVRMTLNDEK
jgi:hypothetical protein